MANDIDTKAISGFEVKDADRGEVTAIVSVLNVVDREGDVVLPGAIRDGVTVKLSGYNHDIVTKGEPPVGQGRITIVGDKAVFTGAYFMDTARGREAFAVVKGLGADSEWSIGFPRNVRTARMTPDWQAKGAKRLIAGMHVMEASPVFVGANGLTATVSTKASDQADGSGFDEELVTVAKEAVSAHLAKVDAEKAEAEQNRIALETKAAADAEAARVAAADAERSRQRMLIDAELAKFNRNMRIA